MQKLWNEMRTRPPQNEDLQGQSGSPCADQLPVDCNDALQTGWGSVGGGGWGGVLFVDA